jgi:endonuclease YncB( thermonuclease family)
MKWFRHKISPYVFVLLFLFDPLSLQAADSQITWAKTVFASDTISVMRGGRAVKVRLHGIDCPEKKQVFGTRAKQYMVEMAFGKEAGVRIHSSKRFKIRSYLCSLRIPSEGFF